MSVPSRTSAPSSPISAAARCSSDALQCIFDFAALHELIALSCCCRHWREIATRGTPSLRACISIDEDDEKDDERQEDNDDGQDKQKEDDTDEHDGTDKDVRSCPANANLHTFLVAPLHRRIDSLHVRGRAGTLVQLHALAVAMPWLRSLRMTHAMIDGDEDSSDQERVRMQPPWSQQPIDDRASAAASVIAHPRPLFPSLTALELTGIESHGSAQMVDAKLLDRLAQEAPLLESLCCAAPTMASRYCA
jgi:hypothetical protein